MLKNLTKEQAKQLIKSNEEWRKYGLSCERINKETTKNCISELYKFIGRKPPILIFCPSLLSAQYQIAYYKNMFKLNKDIVEKNLGGNLNKNIGYNQLSHILDNINDVIDNDDIIDKLGDNLYDNLEQKLIKNLGENLSNDIIYNLWYKLCENIRYNLIDNITDNLKYNLWYKLCDNLNNLINNLWHKINDNLTDRLNKKYECSSLLGSMDAHWIAFYEFPKKFLGIRYCKKYEEILDTYSTLAKSCSWVWCYENYCFVSDRPEKILFNKQNKLHCEDGPAVKWIDGWEIYYWNDIEISKQWIVDKNSITKETIIKEKNAEKRRCIREIIGAKQYATLIDIKEIERDY